MKILLDTNVISELMKKSPDKKVVEILEGISRLPDGKRKLSLETAAHKILELFSEKTLPFDKFAANFYSKLVCKRFSLGQPIDFADAQIAAIALQNKMTLATRNTKDFKNIEGLQIINPWLSASPASKN